MARWDKEELNWSVDTYPNAPCHTCAYRDKNDNGGAKVSCDKYPVPRYSIGVNGKPEEILLGTAPCEYYKNGVNTYER